MVRRRTPRVRQPGVPSPWSRRWALALVALSALVLLVDLARPTWVAPVRTAAADVLAPVQEALVLPGTARVRELTRERDVLRLELDTRTEAAALAQQAERLLGTPPQADLLPARVIGVASPATPLAAGTVTLDVGVLDGVEVDQAVLTADGLVGRVVDVHRRSSDIRVLGDPEVVVGVRVGSDGGLGTVSGDSPPGVPPRGHGELTLTMVGDSTVAAGDSVTTLGSPDGRPYVPGLELGTVVAVDPERGQVGRTAIVRPAVDTDTLDLVGVVLAPPREEPRSPAGEAP